MQKTKYVEVKPSERLPTVEGEFIAVMDPETKLAGFFSFDPEDPDDVEWWKTCIIYWLQEVPDYDDEMKEFIRYVSDTMPSGSSLQEKAKTLLTKLKTEP